MRDFIDFSQSDTLLFQLAEVTARPSAAARPLFSEFRVRESLPEEESHKVNELPLMNHFCREESYYELRFNELTYFSLIVGAVITDARIPTLPVNLR